MKKNMSIVVSILIFGLLIVGGTLILKPTLAHSSVHPYTVNHRFDEVSGMDISTTFTELWSYQTEEMDKPVQCPSKLGLLQDGTYHLSMYAPSKQLLDTLAQYPDADPLLSVWLFLDNEEFFIIVPEEVQTQPRIIENNKPAANDENLVIYYFDLSKAGFHSEKGKLEPIMTPQEINQFVIDELCKHDIVSIQPTLLLITDEPLDLSEIPLVSPTAASLSDARKALTTQSN